jgi:predicted permease
MIVTLMRWWHVARMRLRSLVQRERADAELSRELRLHLEHESDEYIARGMRPEDAHKAALRRFGSMTRVQEECRDMRRTEYIENIIQDIRYAARTLTRTPAFTAVILLTLSLSIGANSAIFSVIEGVLLKPLPYSDPDRIVRIFYHNAQYAKFTVNHFDLRDFRSTAQSFESVAGYTHTDRQLSGTGDSVRLAGFRVTGGFFHVLGVQPARGREFNQNDEIPNSGRVAILSDRVWKDRFGSDPAIIGRKIILDAVPFEVVGVMPPGTDHPGNVYNPVAYGQTVDIWTPFVYDGNPARRGAHYVEAIARLKPAITPQQAESELNSLMANLAKRYNAEKGWTTMVVPLYQEVVGGSRRLLLVLLGAVGLVLLIACVNAANLLLARATARRREIAVRTALGAGRLRLIRQMLTESLLIAIASGAAGAVIAAAGTKMLVSLLPAEFPRAASISIDYTVFGWTLFIALGTGLLFGLAPAWHTARFDLQQSLREGARGTSAGKRHIRLRSALVIGEVAMACVLLVGAGLLLRSFVNLLRTDPGFRPQRALSATVTLPPVNYKDSPDIARFFERGLTEWKNLPGVQAAGVGSDLPWTGYDDNIGGWKYDDRTTSDNPDHARYHVASGDYFRAAGHSAPARPVFRTDRHSRLPRRFSSSTTRWPAGIGQTKMPSENASTSDFPKSPPGRRSLESSAT